MATDYSVMGDFKPMDRDEFLQHYGIKGMKWGVRRKRGGVETSAAPAKPKKRSEDSRAATSAKKKAASEGLQSLSNKELQTMITRMNLEQQYSKLNPKQISPGKKFAMDLVSNTGKQLASQYASQYAKKAVEAALKK